MVAFPQLCLQALAVMLPPPLCAGPAYLWVPVGRRWSAGAWPQGDPRRPGSLPQAGELPRAAAGACGLCHEFRERPTAQQSPGAVRPAGVQGEEAAPGGPLSSCD